MSNESEITKDILNVGKAQEIVNVSQNNVQFEQPLKQSFETGVEVPSNTSEDKMEVLVKNQNIDNEKNSDLLKDLPEKYRLIALNTSDLIAFTTFDIDPIFTFVSPSHKKILGYDGEDLLGRPGLDFIHNDDKQHLMALLLTYIDAKINGALTPDMLENVQKIDFRFRDKSGQWHFLHSTVDIVNNELLLISKDITEQKHIEAELHESNELFSKAFRSSPEMISITTMKEGRYIDVNESFLRTTEYSRDEIIGHTAAELNIWVDPNDYVKFIQELSEKGSIRNLEIRTRKKSSEVNILLISSEIIDIKGEPCALTIMTNITEQKCNEIKLRDNDQRMHAIIQGLSIAAFVLGPDHQIIYWNKALAELSHIRAEEVIGTSNHWKAFYNEKRPCMADILIDGSMGRIDEWYAGKYKKSSLLEESFEAMDFFPNLGDNGKWLRFSAAVIRNENGNLIGVLETLEDISEHKIAEIALQESEERFRLAISSITDILYEWDIKTGSMRWFGDIDSQLGYENGKFPRTIKDFLKHIHPEDVNNVQTVATNGLKSHQKWQGDYRVINKDGAELYWYGTGIGIYDQEGNPIKVVGAVTDISKRKWADDALHRSEEKYRLVTENASDAIWTMDMNLRFTYVSPSNEKMTGYTSEKALKLSLEELLTPESVERAMQTFTAEMQLENSEKRDISRSVTLELNEIKADGTIIPIEARMCLLRDAHQNPIGILGITRDITERKKQEEALKKSEEKFVKAFRSSPVAICITRISDGRFLEVNKSLEKLIGYTRDELLAQTTIGLGIWVDIAERKPLFEELAKTGSVFDREYRFRSKKGDIIFTRYSAEVIDFSGDKSVLSVLIDISEYKKADELLRKSEEKFVKAFRSSPVAICITRMSDGKFIEMNESLEKLSGYSRAELLTGSRIGLNFWADIEDLKQVVEQLAKTGSVHDHEYRFRIKSGNEIVVRYSAEVIDFSGERCCLSVIVDISDRKKMEETLRESEEKYRSIVENTQDVIMLTNPDGRVTYMSPVCFSVLGYNPNDLIGTIPEIFYPDDVEKVHTAFSNALRGVGGFNLEYRILTKSGEKRWVSHSWSPIFMEDHTLKCIVNVIRNITESKINEQNLKEKIEELERYKNITINREIKMIELKKDNEMLKDKIKELEDRNEKGQT